MNIPERFSRNIGAVNEREQERLNRSRVFIAGCGGIGGYVIEHLVRIGVGYIICADSGRFEASNLNRQILCDMRTLGHSKADTAALRAATINPGADVRGITARLDESNLPGFIRGCHLAVDALDNAEARRSLAAACKEQNIPVIHAAVRGWLIQAAFVPPESNLYALLYSDYHGSSAAEVSGVLSFAPAMAASIQAAIAVRYLSGQTCDADLNIYNTQTMEHSRIQI